MTASITRTYRSKNGKNNFTFVFTDKGSYVEIRCTKHPSFGKRSSDPEKTHLYRSGNICFISGKEPRTLQRALKLAGDWAEYITDYIKTGEVQR